MVSGWVRPSWCACPNRRAPETDTTNTTILELQDDTQSIVCPPCNGLGSVMVDGDPQNERECGTCAGRGHHTFRDSAEEHMFWMFVDT